MFELLITSTGKSFSPKSKWRIFDERRIIAGETMTEVYSKLRELYGKAKRVPMFVDSEAGTSKKIGWVIGFRNSDSSHGKAEHWIQQDWISLLTTKSVELPN